MAASGRDGARSPCATGDRRRGRGRRGRRRQRHRRLARRDHAALAEGGAAEPLVAAPRARISSSTTRRCYDALDGHMIFFEHADGRVCIVFPYLGRVLAGSTDIRVDGPAGALRAGGARLHPRCRSPTSSPASPSGRSTSSSATAASGRCRAATRASPGASRAAISSSGSPAAPPPFCMVGGKWTTFRAFAEQTADAVLAELGTPRVAGTGRAHRRRGGLPAEAPGGG